MTVSFSASLRHPSVTAEPPGSWIARGLRTVTSVAVGFDGTPAEPVGVLGWYLIRAGFAREGWALPRAGTGALAVCRPPAAHVRWADCDLADLHVGVVDAALHASQAVLNGAAAVDAGYAAGETLALRVRTGYSEAPGPRPGTESLCSAQPY